MSVYESVAELVGRTPLLHLARYERHYQLSATLLAKLERFNPGGSSKDRVALSMIDDFEARGLLGPGSVLIEPTSGNTGIGLASLAAVRGYRAMIVMPETMSAERRALMSAYGAELVLTPGKEGMAGAIRRAEELAKTLPGALIAGQFDNPANPEAHYRTTGPELWADTEGKIDVFVAGYGTGGTITGVGRYLKERNPAVQIVAVEPEGCPVLTEGHGGAHQIQGIGGGFVPKNLDTSLLDRVIAVPDEVAMDTARALARLEGVLAGISSGAALWAAAQLAREDAYHGKTIAVLLPDTGERYLSTGLFGDGTDA